MIDQLLIDNKVGDGVRKQFTVYLYIVFVIIVIVLLLFLIGIVVFLSVRDSHK